MDSEQEELFQSILLDHESNPRNFFAMDGASRSGSGLNPICGDRYRVYLDLDGERIVRASFYGRGCTLSKASASIMVSLLPGLTVREARALRDDVRSFLTATDSSSFPVSGELNAFAGVRDHPSRVACVMLAWDAMGRATLSNDDE